MSGKRRLTYISAFKVRKTFAENGETKKLVERSVAVMGERLYHIIIIHHKCEEKFRMWAKPERSALSMEQKQNCEKIKGRFAVAYVAALFIICQGGT